MLLNDVFLNLRKKQESDRFQHITPSIKKWAIEINRFSIKHGNEMFESPSGMVP